MGYLARTWKDLDSMKPVMVMVLVETVFALVNVMYKLAANDGMNTSILIAYRFMFGAVFIIPVAFFAERKKRPKLTWKIAGYGFICGLFGGSLGQNLYLRSMVLTSATFSSAMTNLIPAITFVVGISLRLERLNWKAAAGKAKVFGTIIGISGAMLLTFYKGPDINVWNTNINLLKITSTSGQQSLLEHHGGHSTFFVGAVFALISCVFYSLWLITQAKASEIFPCPYSLTAMMTLSASFQGVVFALCVERDWSKWRMGWNIRLLTVAVAGVLGSGMMFTWVAWCVRMRGPHFVSTFQPLMLLMVAMAGSLFLEERLHLGIVLGAILIVAGLYSVLWGKARELNASRSKSTQDDIENPSQIPSPLPPQHQYGTTGVARDGGKVEAEGEEEEKRDSQASSEILNSTYMYHR